MERMANLTGMRRVNAGNPTVPAHLEDLFERSVNNLDNDEKSQLLQVLVKHQGAKNVKEIQQFLGLCNYYRRFINQFSDIASPLTHLTKKSVDFVWDDRCLRSFEKLKQALCEAPVLSYPMNDGEFILDCDASDSGIGESSHRFSMVKRNQSAMPPKN